MKRMTLVPDRKRATGAGPTLEDRRPGQCCAYREMGSALPGLIVDLHASINAGHDDARLLRLAVLLHVLGT